MKKSFASLLLVLLIPVITLAQEETKQSTVNRRQKEAGLEFILKTCPTRCELP
jgi:hypothetical protein